MRGVNRVAQVQELFDDLCLGEGRGGGGRGGSEREEMYEYY